MSRRNGILGNVLVGLLSAVALTLGSFRLKDWLFAAPSPPISAVRVKDWAQYSEVGERLGSPSAKLDIVMFSDFQCPYCRAAAANLEEIQRHRPEIAVLYRHFPLSGHRSAMSAAQASVCASRQHSFKGMHHELFLHQDSLGRKPWGMYALAAGVPDTMTFDSCMRDSTLVGEIRRDSIAGAKLGIIGTPTLLIRDLRIDGSPSLKELDQYVAEALRASGH